MSRKRTSQKASSSALASLLTHLTLRKIAGPAYFERGEGYFADGRVGNLLEDGDSLTAKVRGTHDYRVKLWVEDGRLDASCTCPLGEEGAFCKHCVAVGLTWLDQRREGEKGAGRTKTPRVNIQDIRRFLSARAKDELVDLVMEQAKSDDQLYLGLMLKAAKAAAKPDDLEAFRYLIDLAVGADGGVSSRDAHEHSRRIEEAIETLAGLLRKGRAVEVMELAEYAVAALEKSAGVVGEHGGIMDELLHQLEELHLAACQKAKPDPPALARRLFVGELNSGWGTFGDCAVSYAEVLGREGLAEYRRLVEAEWKRLPTKTPKTRDDQDYDGKGYKISRMMESLARQSGDLEELVAIKSRDLSSPYAYLSIAQMYEEAGQHDLALEWAEKGLRAFPERPDSRLREFLANQYHRRKQHDRALALVWEEFAEAPGLHGYQQLKSHAEKSGEWPAWREKALSYLHETSKKRRGKLPVDPWAERPDHSELVRIFLWEKNVEAAWQEAQAGGCYPELWLELARKRENDHPADVLPIYQRRVEPTLAQKNNPAYAEAVKLLQKIKSLMSSLGREREFGPYLEAIRNKHKQKRNFMKLLDRSHLN